MNESSLGREQAFRATLDSQWRLLALQDDSVDGSLVDTVEESASGVARQPIRSPFLVCGNRHPDVIHALESLIHRARTQLAYSRWDTACLLAGLRLDEVDAVRQSEGIHVVEPVPQPAKLSRSLHAKLDNISESPDGATASPNGGSPASNKRSGKNSGETQSTRSVAGTFSNPRRGEKNEEIFRHSGDNEQQQQQQSSSTPRSVVFNHGEGVPSDLDVSLTPGTWDRDMANAWMEHLTSFESTAHLWEEHLRERFLWTRRSSEKDQEVVEGSTVGEGTKGGEGGGRRSLRDEALTSEGPLHRRRNALVEAHGLEGVESLWDQTAERSSRDGACDFQRLRASSAAEPSSPETNPRRSAKGGPEPHKTRPRRGEGSAKRPRKGSAADERTGGGTHDRVVIRGAGSLGTTPQDNAHCLLTVLAYLVTLPEVAYVDDLPQVFELNVEAAWITQSGEETTYSIWEQGIDGRTEVCKKLAGA